MDFKADLPLFNEKSLTARYLYSSFDQSIEVPSLYAYRRSFFIMHHANSPFACHKLLTIEEDGDPHDNHDYYLYSVK